MHEWPDQTREVAGETVRLSPTMTGLYEEADLAAQIDAAVQALPDGAECTIGRLRHAGMADLPIIVFRHGAEIRVMDVMDHHGSDCDADMIGRHADAMERAGAGGRTDTTTAVWLSMAAQSHRTALAERMYEFPLAETTRLVEMMREAGAGPMQSNEVIEELVGGRSSVRAMAQRHGLYRQPCDPEQAARLVRYAEALGLQYDVLEKIALLLEADTEIIETEIPDLMTDEDFAPIAEQIRDAGFGERAVERAAISLNAEGAP